MALYNAGYLSPIRKKLGNAVGRKWRTLNVLAVYQPNVSNPNTEAQQIVRERFANAAHVAMRAASFIQTGLHGFCRNTAVPPRSQFIGMNFSRFSMGGTITYAQLQFSNGPLEEPVIDGVAGVATPLTISYHMNTNFVEGPYCNSHDTLHIGAYDPTLKRFFVGDTRVRSDDEISIEFPSQVGGHRVHVYLFCKGTDNNDTVDKCSPTIYGGEVQVTAS